MGAEDGIARRGHQDAITRIDQCRRQIESAALLPIECTTSVSGWMPSHCIHGRDSVRRRFLQYGSRHIVRVASILRLAHFFTQFLNDLRERHLVRLAHAHINDFATGMRGYRRALGLLDFLELINCVRLAALAAANPLGEKLLYIGMDIAQKAGNRALFRATTLDKSE